MTNFSIPHEKKWLRPDKAFFEAKSEGEGINTEELEYNGKYKRIREKRDLAVFGLCLYEIYRTPYFVQMNSLSDSPDAFVMRVAPNDSTTHEIGSVEITFYGRNRIGLPDQSLGERLSEKSGKFLKLPPKYCLLIHIGKGLVVDYEDITNRLRNIKNNFQVFSVQEISSYPDTIARVVSCRPEYSVRDINVGEICFNLKESNIPMIANEIYGKLPKNN